MQKQILIIDDYPQLVEFLTERLSAEGYSVRSAATGAQGLQIVSSGFRGAILLDVRLPDISGLELFEQVKALDPDIPVIFITAHATVDLAVEATRRGAFDFIAKGSDLIKRLSVAVKNAVDRVALSEQLKTLQKQLGAGARFEEFLTVSPKTLSILKTLDAVVNSGVTVLIEGESGTGKELIARGIHQRGSRKGGPFVVANCAGIPESLLESEMFGYEKGAFTGATTRRIGRFEAAHGGTLFLDEIGEMPLALQAKLLRVLQDHTFERVGGNESVRVDVRVISATNRDLQEEVRRGRFREDLYYRLAVFPVRLPPLRERPEDIPVLAQHFLRRFAAEEGKDVSGFTPDAMAALSALPYPGNVRELQNLVRHAVILTNGRDVTLAEIRNAMGSHGMHRAAAQPVPTLSPDRPLPERIALAFPDLSSIEPIEAIETEILRRALALASGNVSLAARTLGIGRATFYRRLQPEKAAAGPDREPDPPEPPRRR